MDELIAAIEFAGELFPEAKPANAATTEGMKSFFKDFCSHKEYDPLFMPGGVIYETALRFIDECPFPVAHQCHNISQQFFDQNHDKVFQSGFWMGITIGDIMFNGKPVFGATKDTIRDDIARGSDTDAPLNLHVWLTFGNMQIMDLTAVPSLLSKQIARHADFRGQTLISTKPRKTSKLQYKPILVYNDFLRLVDDIDGFAFNRKSSTRVFSGNN
jgi:hypothetical protein